MKLFQRMAEWLRRRSYRPAKQDDGASPIEKSACAHGKTDHPLVVTVLGIKCELERSPMCPACTEQYFNKFSILCASCHQPIFPGTPVGVAWVGAPHPFTHLTFDCCESGGLFCGRWGEGRLLTLHEIDPEHFPADTASAVIENVN